MKISFITYNRNMGKVLSVIQRKANRFNVENRAQRVISKEKQTPAPKYPSTIQELETIKRDYPHSLEEQSKKDFSLDDRLKQVYVRSEDPAVAEESTYISRTLPQDRAIVEDFEFGYQEPAMIPQGRFTLKQAVKFITDHQMNPNTWTAAAIAKEYNINEEKLEKILFYYQTFKVYIPEKMDKKAPKKLFTNATEVDTSQQLLQSQEKVQHQEQK